MDDALGPRTLLPVSVDMGHDVVAHQLLPLLCHIVVNVVRKSLQLINLFLCNMYCISLLAYRSERGLWYLSFIKFSSYCFSYWIPSLLNTSL